MLPNNYETYCDPRLNYMQAIEAAFKISSAVQANPPTKKARAS